MEPGELTKSMKRSDVLIAVSLMDDYSTEDLKKFIRILYSKTERMYEVLFAIEIAIKNLKETSEGDAFKESMVVLMEKIGLKLREALES